MAVDNAVEIQDKDKPVTAQVTDQKLIVTLGDGRVLGVPLSWYPFLAKATPEQRQNFALLPNAVLWADLDDGVSIRGLIKDIAMGDPDFRKVAEGAK